MKNDMSHMTEGEKVHLITEGIYRVDRPRMLAMYQNLLDNFNPGIRQLICTGRAFQKSLHNMASSAKVYIDSIYALAQGAQVCKGATTEIGAALLQIAEVQREINTQVIDNIKSFHAELLIPLETKQESEFKAINLIHKKYIAGHKYHLGPLEKAQTALKKQRKKSKTAKYGFDQKEYQISKEVRECQARLDEYRSQSLRQALLEERKRYCVLLDRICAMMRNYASHHSKAQELCTHRLSEWTDLTKNMNTLPSASEAFLQAFRLHQEDVYNSPEDDGARSHGSDRDFDSEDTPRRKKNLTMCGTSAPPSLNYGTAGSLYGQEDPYALRSTITVPNPPPQSRPRVRALYTHQATTDTQLNFVEGDLIALIGDKRDGWQYGENLSTHRMGWFPIAFVQPISAGRGLSQRVRSLSNLADLDPNQDGRHGPERGGYSTDNETGTLQRSRTIGERPISLYANKQQMAEEAKLADSSRAVTWATLVAPSRVPTTAVSHVQERPLPVRPNTSPYEQQQQRNYNIYSQYPGSVANIGNEMSSPTESPYRLPPPTTMPPPPPLPPPETDPVPGPPRPPPHPPGGQNPGNPTMLPPQQHPNGNQANYHDYGHVSQFAGVRSDNSDGGGQGDSHRNMEGIYQRHTSRSLQPPPLQPPPPPPTNHHPSPPPSSSGYSGSSNRANPSSSGSHYSLYGTSGPASPGFPPPPPNLAPPSPPPTSDYEEPDNNMFTAVKLKRTVTNDRSAPKMF